jgi:hypothetical protein
MEDLANTSIVHPWDPGSNLDAVRKYFSYSACAQFEFESAGC